MKTTLKLLVAGAMVLGLASASQAQQIDYYLWIDSPNGSGIPTVGNWSLSAQVSGPNVNGLASFVVNLDNATAGTNVAPRGVDGNPTAGFAHGVGVGGGPAFMDFTPVGGQAQAFARQHISAHYPPGSGMPVDQTNTTVVNGIGVMDVPDANFNVPASTLVGSSLDRNPFAAGRQIEVFNGTYAGGASTRIKFSAATTGTVPGGSTNNIAVTGGGAGLLTMQPANAGSLYRDNPPPGWVDPSIGNLANEYAVGTPTFAYHVVWTPDINSDGIVDVLDAQFLITNWGQAANPYDRNEGNLNGDGIVDVLDAQYLITSWGQTLYSGGGVTPVPEPSGIILLAAASIGIAFYGRKRIAQKSAC